MGIPHYSDFLTLAQDTTALVENVSLSRLKVDTIRQLLQVSGRWVSLVDDSPALISLLMLSSNEPHKTSTDLLFRQLATTLIIARHQQANHHTLQHIIAGVLSQPQLWSETKVTRQDLTAAYRTLQQLQFHLWASLLCPKPIIRKYYESNAKQWFHIAISLADTIEASRNKPFFDVLQKWYLAVPPALQSTLSELVCFPGYVPVGSKTEYKGKPVIVVNVTAQQITLLNANTTELYCAQANELSRLSKPISAVELNELLEQQTGAFEGKTLTSPFVPSFPISRPPATLTAILVALKKPDIEIATLCTLVEKSPAFQHFLTASASQDNRQQLPVASLRQSIMTYGLERIGHMLVQYALNERLTQHAFVLHPLLNRFMTIVIGIASELATKINGFTPQQAALVASLLCSPLFTLPELKVLTRFTDDATRHYDISTLLPQRHGPKTQQLLLTLSNAWKQDKSEHQLILLNGKLPSQVPEHYKSAVAAMGLSLLWARKWLFNANVDTQENRLFIQQSASILGNISDIETQTQQAISQHIYWPLR